MTKLIRVAIAGALLIGASAFITACNDDEASSENNASQGTVDDISARVQRNEVLAALTAIGALPLHDQDESIQAGEIPSRAAPDTRTLLRYLTLTNWGSDLQAGADAIKADAIVLLAAVEEGDVEAAKEPATAVHEGWHDFSDEAWETLVGDLPPEEGGVEAHDEAEATPAADGTAPTAGDETPGADGTEESH